MISTTSLPVLLSNDEVGSSANTSLGSGFSRHVEKLTPDLTPQPPCREGGVIKASNATCYNAGNPRNAVAPPCRGEVWIGVFQIP
jgi:hypothetical protein